MLKNGNQQTTRSASSVLVHPLSHNRNRARYRSEATSSVTSSFANGPLCTESINGSLRSFPLGSFTLRKSVEWYNLIFPFHSLTQPTAQNTSFFPLFFFPRLNALDLILCWGCAILGFILPSPSKKTPSRPRNDVAMPCVRTLDEVLFARTRKVNATNFPVCFCFFESQSRNLSNIPASNYAENLDGNSNITEIGGSDSPRMDYHTL